MLRRLPPAVLLLSLSLFSSPAAGQSRGVEPPETPAAFATHQEAPDSSARPPEKTTMTIRESEPSRSRIVVLWAYGIGAGLFYALFLVQLLLRGDAPQIESHWGGFGGGLGGWRLSPSAAFLLAALVLSGLVAVVTVEREDQENPQKPAGATTSQKESPVAETPTAEPTPIPEATATPETTPTNTGAAGR